MNGTHDSKEPKLRGHEIDGIQEYDNMLPRWWVWLYQGTVVFGVIYLIQLHVLGGQTIEQEFAQAQTEAAAQAAAPAGSDGTVADGAGEPAADPAQMVAAGKDVFDVNCTPCHGAVGQGGIGPNLTDNHWIHGNSDADLLKIIDAGLSKKECRVWGPILGERKMKAALAYVRTLYGTNPPDGKAPEGQEVSQ